MCVVNGACVAGGVFTALCHDQIIMVDAKNAYMSTPELFIDKVVPYLFVRIVTEMTNGHTARQLMLCSKIRAAQALRLNLI